MGTTWSVRAVSPPPDAQARIEAVLASIIAEMSNWEQDSAISRFNRARPGTWHSLPGQFLTVLQTALGIAEESCGAFDPALGEVTDHWGFGPSLKAAAGATAPTSGGRWRAIELDPPARLALQPGEVVLDFSGIAKGYAVERVAEALREAGCIHFLVEIGGELRGEGIKPDGQPWWIDMEAAPELDAPPLRVALHQLSAATSGDYRRFFMRDGRRYAHSFDPRTGAPLVNDVSAVTVLHESCMMADAYATAITVLGPEVGMRFAAERALAVRMLVRRSGGVDEHVSPALEAMLD